MVDIYTCSTVDLFQYTCIFLSKVGSFLDFRFSLKWVYLFCKFHGFQNHLMISYCE